MLVGALNKEKVLGTMKLREGSLTALLDILHPGLGLALAFQTLDRANCGARADTAPSPQHLHTLATTWPGSQHSTRVMMDLILILLNFLPDAVNCIILKSLVKGSGQTI